MFNLEFFVFTYYLLALLIGVMYTFYWVRGKMPSLVGEVTRGQKMMVIAIVFVMSTVGAPLSLYELWKENKKNKLL